MSYLKIEKEKVFIVLEIVEYVSHSVVIKNIIKKNTGNVTAVSFAKGETLTERTSAFDAFLQVIDGKAEVKISSKSHFLITGDSIIIPAHCRHAIKANERFKMIFTIIKSGYEEVNLS